MKAFLHVLFFLNCKCILICKTTKPLIFCHIVETKLGLLRSNFCFFSASCKKKLCKLKLINLVVDSCIF